MGYLGYEFLLPEYNHRTDEYGGSIENRVRFVREMIEVTKDAVGKDCGVALRVSLEELRGRPGRNQPSEAHELDRAPGGRSRPLRRQDGFQPDRLLGLALHAARAATSR